MGKAVQSNRRPVHRSDYDFPDGTDPDLPVSSRSNSFIIVDIARISPSHGVDLKNPIREMIGIFYDDCSAAIFLFSSICVTFITKYSMFLKVQ
jgi:hypothetical protein